MDSIQGEKPPSHNVILVRGQRTEQFNLCAAFTIDNCILELFGAIAFPKHVEGTCRGVKANISGVLRWHAGVRARRGDRKTQ